MSFTNKRLFKELLYLYNQQNSKPLLENDYLIYFDESNINNVKAIIKAPFDSVYKHKFIRLNFKIPENYPYSPPEVTFVNYDSVRIHPNMYENGKCCSTILNTWGDNIYEKWTSSMNVETILLTFHSFLDNNPYTYEPGGTDDPTYTVYVLYQSWKSCLIRYIQKEDISIFKDFVNTYLLTHVNDIFNDLNDLCVSYPEGVYFTRCFEIDEYTIDYSQIFDSLQHHFFNISVNNSDNEHHSLHSDNDFDCNICFDTVDDCLEITLQCSHVFHLSCLDSHVFSNNYICPMCRSNIDWITNPLTNRKIKIGGKTWKYLMYLYK